MMNKSVIDCAVPRAFAEGKMCPSLTYLGSEGHRKDLSVYQKIKNIAMVFLL